MAVLYGTHGDYDVGHIFGALNSRAAEKENVQLRNYSLSLTPGCYAPRTVAEVYGNISLACRTLSLPRGVRWPFPFQLSY